MLREPVGDGGREAYIAIEWGRLLSRESQTSAEAEAVREAEGNMIGTAMRGADALPWSKTLSRAKRSRRNLGDLTPDRERAAAPARIGKARSRSQ